MALSSQPPLSAQSHAASQAAPDLFQRSAGIILHPTSLPSDYGIGELGSHALRWLDFLAEAGQHLWQVMPLGPTGYGDSPYQCFSAFAGNPYLISLEQLQADGLLENIATREALSHERVDYGAVIPFKLEQLSKAFAAFQERAQSEQNDFEQFCEAKAAWLEDYALFMALKEAHQGQAWHNWAPALRDRQPTALEHARQQYAETLRKHKFWQYLFFQQWQTVKNYAESKAIRIIGDIPIFVAYDSADVWANPALFYLDATAKPTVVAGVPPDYFSPTGQLWGNPLYRWDAMQADGFAWWLQRLESLLEWVDIIRLDHFRGFDAYWEVPAQAENAVTGRWLAGPQQPFFDALKARFGDNLPIIAEDLGVITPSVERLRDANGLAGMKVLQFAFSGDAHHPFLPHTYPHHAVVYTGTHDNDTSKGWYGSLAQQERDFLNRYCFAEVKADDVAHRLIRLAASSVATFSLTTLQDALQLGSEARMNMPSQAAGNWQWRFSWHDIPAWLATWLGDVARAYGRTP